MTSWAVLHAWQGLSVLWLSAPCAALGRRVHQPGAQYHPPGLTSQNHSLEPSDTEPVPITVSGQKQHLLWLQLLLLAATAHTPWPD